MIASTPNAPYYAVIFTSLRTEGNDGYSDMASEMAELASKQDGFLGLESAREDVGITISYWCSMEDIKNWKANERHVIAQKSGR